MRLIPETKNYDTCMHILSEPCTLAKQAMRLMHMQQLLVAAAAETPTWAHIGCALWCWIAPNTAWLMRTAVHMPLTCLHYNWLSAQQWMRVGAYLAKRAKTHIDWPRTLYTHMYVHWMKYTVPVHSDTQKACQSAHTDRKKSTSAATAALAWPWYSDRTSAPSVGALTCMVPAAAGKHWLYC